MGILVTLRTMKFFLRTLVESLIFFTDFSRILNTHHISKYAMMVSNQGMKIEYRKLFRLKSCSDHAYYVRTPNVLPCWPLPPIIRKLLKAYVGSFWWHMLLAALVGSEEIWRRSLLLQIFTSNEHQLREHPEKIIYEPFLPLCWTVPFWAVSVP